MKNSEKRCLAILLSVVLLLNVNIVSYASENVEQANKFSEGESSALSQQGHINKNFELREKKGWNEERGYKYYCDESGNKVVGLQKIDNKTYFFDEQGYMQIGWQIVEEHRYYFDINLGARYENRICEIDGMEYEFDAEGNAKELKKDENGQNKNNNVEAEETEDIINDAKKQSNANDKVALSSKEQTVPKGWVEESDNTYYYDSNGNKVIGMRKIGRKIYYFEEKNGSGALVKTSWVTVNNKKYYAMPDGGLRIGWLSFGDEYYYCGEDGAIIYGKQKIDEKLYYFNEKGIRQTGWIETEDGKSYGMSDGSLREGWLSFGDTYYYCGKDGAVVYGRQKIDGKWYYFNEEGIRQTGWIETEEGKCYGMPDGSLREGWLSFGDTYYYCNDKALIVTGLCSINSVLYNFDDKGILTLVEPGWHEIDGKKYYGMPDGTYRVGWLSFGDTYYYCGKDGAVVYGRQKIDGKWYYFNEEGIRQTGWIETEEGKCYGMPDGSLREGWLSFGDTYYYCNDKALIVTGLCSINSVLYNFDDKGILTLVEPGWHEIDGKKYYGMPDGTYRVGWLSFGDTYYYCGKDGAVVYGRQKIDGKWYYFNEEGIRQTGWIETEEGKCYGMPDGSLREGWLSFGETYYYCDDSGKLVKGKQKIGKKWYYFNEEGIRQTGWIETEDGKSYGLSDGSLREGWLSFGNIYYYCDNTGIVVIDDYAIDGILYTFNKNGVMQKKKGWGEYQGNKYYFNPETGFPYKGWVTFGSTHYYADNRGIMVKGWYYISGYYYYFYPDTCIMARNTTIDGYKIGADGRREKTGWYYENGYKFYYKNGVKQLDLDGILPRQSSYWIKVNRTTCSVTVYAKDGANGYIIPVKRFACSVGLPSTPTPTGTYYTPAKYRWHTLMGPSYGQYCTRIVGGVLFHSVAGYNMTSYNIKAKDYNKLGQPASHGCVRLTVRDAKWIYDNCPLNTKVTIYDSSDPGPLGKPATIKIPAGQNWDPTDPNI